MSETWLDFRNRCMRTAQSIKATNDDGMYAKLYAQDVDRLVRMLDHVESSPDPHESSCVSEAFGATGEDS